MSAVPKSFDGRRPAQPISGVSFLTRQIAINASEFQANNTMNFKIPGHLETQFLDCSSSYLKIKVVNNSGAAGSASQFTLGPGGAGNLIQKVHVSQAGNTIVSHSDYGKWRAMETALTADSSYYEGQGATLSGVEHLGHGQVLANGDSVVYVEPLSFHGSLFGQQKVLPMAGMEIDLAYTIGSAEYGGSWATGTPASNWLKIIEVELCLQCIQLSDQSTAMLRKMNPNWSILTKAVGTYHHVVDSGVTNHSINLGANYSQMLGYDFVFTSQSANQYTSQNNTMFIQNNLRRHNLQVDGVLVENGRSVSCDSPAEIVAFNAIERGVLAKTSGLPSLLNHTNILATDKAACVFSQSLEIFKASCSGFANYAKENFCTGRSTISSSVVLGLEFAPAAATASNVTTFVKYAQLITYDPEHKLFRISQ